MNCMVFYPLFIIFILILNLWQLIVLMSVRGVNTYDVNLIFDVKILQRNFSHVTRLTIRFPVYE